MKKATKKQNGDIYYLLGETEAGHKYWWKKPTWDCGWYWSVDWMDSTTAQHHTHIRNYGTSLFFQLGTEKKFLLNTPFTEDEKWELLELFYTLIQLKEIAEFYHKGHTGISDRTTRYLDLKNKKEADNINENLIPQVTTEIEKIIKGEEL